MAKAFLLSPEDVIDRLRVRYRNQRRRWLSGKGRWPLRIALGVPSERSGLENRSRVKSWRKAWSNWKGPGKVKWVERRWRVAGTQRLPADLTIPTPEALVDCIGEGETWRRAVSRVEEIRRRWAPLSSIVDRDFQVLSDWTGEDFRRLLDLLQWLATHRRAGMYVRQLPVPGVDTKWLGSHQDIVEKWLRAILGEQDGADLFDVAGLRRTPSCLRLRLLDPELRRRVGGLGDISAPTSDLEQLDIPIRRVFIVENLQTGLAFQDLEGSVVFMNPGYAVRPFAEIRWLASIPCLYWGDLDTHGFSILNLLRQHVPHASSLMMDSDTLFAHRRMWVKEPKPAATGRLSRLTREERSLIEAIRQHRWGERIRLEQERIPWEYAWSRILQAADG